MKPKKSKRRGKESLLDKGFPSYLLPHLWLGRMCKCCSNWPQNTVKRNAKKAERNQWKKEADRDLDS